MIRDLGKATQETKGFPIPPLLEGNVVPPFIFKPQP